MDIIMDIMNDIRLTRASLDYRKGAPFYKCFTIHDIKVYPIVKHRWHSNYKRTVADILNHRDNSFIIKEENENEKDYFLPNKFTLLSYPDLEEDNCRMGESIFRNTFCKDVDGQDIYVTDLLHIVSDSLMNNILGSVIFNPLTARYEVAIFHNSNISKNWPETVPLTDYSWKLIKKEYPRFDFAGNKYEYATRMDLDNLNISPCDVTLDYWCESTDWIGQYELNITQEYFKCKAVTEDGLEILGYPFQYLDKYYMMPYNVAYEEIENFPIIKRESIRQCIFQKQSWSPVTSIYEGDKLVSLVNPNIYGYLVYLPERAQYCVEIPESIIPRDEIFDGFMPITKELTDPLELELACKYRIEHDKQHRDPQLIREDISEERNWIILWKSADS